MSKYCEDIFGDFLLKQPLETHPVSTFPILCLYCLIKKFGGNGHKVCVCVFIGQGVQMLTCCECSELVLNSALPAFFSPFSFDIFFLVLYSSDTKSLTKGTILSCTGQAGQ